MTKNEPKILRIPNFEPREYQLAFLRAMDEGCKRGVLVWHRRAGKEIECFNFMIKMAYWHRVGTYIYFFPTTGLGRRILWNGIDGSGKRFLDYVPKEILDGPPNSSEMKIQLTNGSIIQVMGTDMIINVGVNPVGCIFSEFSIQNPYSWNFTRPILRENGGWAVFNYTPRGRNHAYDHYLMAKNNPDWFCQLLTVEDTFKSPGVRVITDEDIEAERAEGMSEQMIQQEYYCNFDQGAEGSYYAKLLNKAEIEGRITSVPHDPHKSVDTSWDLGVGDETVILFTQCIGQEVHLIDMYRNQGEGLDHYAKVLKDKADEGKWNYGHHYAPHDIQVRELGSGAQTRKDIARELGVDFEIVPNLGISEGIELARGLFPRLWVDSTKCKYFVKAAENYHKNYNERLNVYSDKPIHDWSSHCFVGETKIWTRNGMQRIMDLPNEGEVLTLSGWSSYECPRITRKNAKLVEVKFQDGTKVRCTRDHLFLTEKGWKSAESLKKDIKIQSSLMQEHNILMENCIDYGQMKITSAQEEKDSTGLCGKMHLGKYLKGVISTIKTETQRIIDCLIWSVLRQANTLVRAGTNLRKKDFHQEQRLEKKLPSGIGRKQEEYGINNMRKDVNHGQSGSESQKSAFGAKRFSNVLSEKMVMNKNIATQIAKPLIIENVREIENLADVWCLTVPNEEHFSLENGAIVHNCMDAFRYMAIMQNKRRGPNMSEEDADKLEGLYSRK